MRVNLLKLSAWTTAVLIGLVGSAAAQGAGPVAPTVLSVGGGVVTPATYTAEQLGAFATVEVGGLTGVPLLDVVNASAPVVPAEPAAAGNRVLRLLITVTGREGSVTFARGELDPGFGNHPALLRPGGSGTSLVVPGDAKSKRSLTGVRSIVVASAAADMVTDLAPGSFVVQFDGSSRTVDAAALAALKQHVVTVTYLKGTTPETRTYRGPSLADVLRLAGVPTGPAQSVSVTGVGSDGYAAAVTLAEQAVGERSLYVALDENLGGLWSPMQWARLLVAGDVKGGRYVSLLTTLEVERR